MATAKETSLLVLREYLENGIDPYNKEDVEDIVRCNGYPQFNMTDVKMDAYLEQLKKRLNEFTNRYAQYMKSRGQKW